VGLGKQETFASVAQEIVAPVCLLHSAPSSKLQNIVAWTHVTTGCRGASEVCPMFITLLQGSCIVLRCKPGCYPE